MKHKIFKILAAAGSFVVLFGGQMVIKPYASAEGHEEFLVSGPEDCRRLLTEMVSQTLPGERKEYFLTGEDYEPESLVIAQMFSDTVNISNTKIKDYQKNGHRYVTCRIGFERVNGQKESETTEEEEGSVIGHHWQIGDIRSLKLGNKTYRFRCIDEDYRGNSDDQICALFLCDTVIRSDVDSTDSKREILTFGRNNNYKTSDVRAWLKKNFKDTLGEIPSVSTGVNSAYLGATIPGDFAEFAETGFLRYELPTQLAADELFLLSLEEAFEYRDFLWEVSGGGSSYDRGYWLRTPAYSENETGDFFYGKWSYAVDLELGCIRPADVFDGSMGLCPAFCLPQG